MRWLCIVGKRKIEKTVEMRENAGEGGSPARNHSAARLQTLGCSWVLACCWWMLLSHKSRVGPWGWMENGNSSCEVAARVDQKELVEVVEEGGCTTGMVVKGGLLEEYLLVWRRAHHARVLVAP